MVQNISIWFWLIYSRKWANRDPQVVYGPNALLSTSQASPLSRWLTPISAGHPLGEDNGLPHYF